MAAGCGSDGSTSNAGSDGLDGGIEDEAPTPITISIDNQKSAPVIVYMGFNGNTFGCYSASDFSSFCTFDTGNPVMCRFSLGAASSQVIPFGMCCKESGLRSAACVAGMSEAGVAHFAA